MPVEDILSFLGNKSTVFALGAVAMTSSYYLATRATPVKPVIDLKKQSIVLEGDERIHVSPLMKNGKFLEYRYEDVRTVYDAFLRGRRLSGDGPCYGQSTTSGFVWTSYNEVYDLAQALACGLFSKGVVGGQDTLIGIYAQNRFEWGVSDVACLMFSMVSVPLYDTLGSDACSYIINKGNIASVIVDTDERARKLISDVSEMKCLKRIIMVEEISEDLKRIAEKEAVELLGFYDIIELGKNNLQEPMPPQPTDLHTVCNTSGTTGNPKGVMLTHRNIIATAASFQEIAEGPSELKFEEGTTHLSYLPLAHMYERLTHLMLLMHGGRIAFYSGDIKAIMKDLQAIKPDGFPSVPRLLNRVYDKVIQSVESGGWLKRKLFYMALNAKKRELDRGIVTRTSIWDKLVFSKIQNMLGGNIKVVFSGAAPLAPDVMTFLRCALGCHVIEGYGQTESGVAVTFTVPGDHSTGHVGPPISCCMIKLVDVPDMEYYAANDKGEVCYKGVNIFKGYLNDPEKTKDAVDEDGWLHSGDIGQWLPNGTLKIIDRKKHIYKLAQGEYIAPEKIENIYMKSSLVEQVWVHGDSFQSFSVGIVVPDRETMPKWAADKGFPCEYEELCRNEEVKKMILENMQSIGKESGLKSFEQVKIIHVTSVQWTVENSLLTPTFKLKRPTLKKQFAEVISRLYSK
ncbi:long-chain-fatty-acid--CoA ligase 1-like [Anneissia japonica]|uniref:long-chain-fatty-acid--CoA ligase 1-like n=1 Tax=Anneissia japonica TaxID=1529436 RepID=UPI001425A15F|nr:long-chain-fatty-acid--CoA ligase 1-like [Anneissia japonica]XP_033096901.1 long-chain-fatty-acid--CoA ligase 1-like [Anneissia japonica]